LRTWPKPRLASRLGPRTREMIKAFPQKDSNKKDEDEGLLRKGVDAALRK
jgi:hypothetical protein